MDVVGQITSITAQVLRRLADGVDSPAAPSEPAEVHIHVHLHGDAEVVESVKGQFPFRYRGKR